MYVPALQVHDTLMAFDALPQQRRCLPTNPHDAAVPLSAAPGEATVAIDQLVSPERPCECDRRERGWMPERWRVEARATAEEDCNTKRCEPAREPPQQSAEKAQNISPTLLIAAPQ